MIRQNVRCNPPSHQKNLTRRSQRQRGHSASPRRLLLLLPASHSLHAPTVHPLPPLHETMRVSSHQRLEHAVLTPLLLLPPLLLDARRHTLHCRRQEGQPRALRSAGSPESLARIATPLATPIPAPSSAKLLAPPFHVGRRNTPPIPREEVGAPAGLPLCSVYAQTSLCRSSKISPTH